MIALSFFNNGSSRPMRSFSFLFLTILCVTASVRETSAAVDFEKEILPILQEHCIDCHGPEKQKSAFRLDQRAIMLKGGDSGLAALVPGDPKASFLIEVINGSDPDMIMPPKGDPLTKEEVKLFETWIAEGAVWPGQMDAVAEVTTDHWSFQPVQRPQLPSEAKNPIDAFLNAALADADLKPNEPAAAGELIRRASIILTGLPPTPERVAAFKTAHAENPDQAYEKLVDELLSSPHFGERWAQHWLDVIRWAETNGSEANLYRKNAWLYRDYVVRAFNEDVPYDQFVREQIAGDSLGSGEATGFLVAGPHVPAATVGREPAAIRQARADRMDEVMQTVGASIMGVTVGCARCHNHKFDPISITDYYAMTAVFQDVEFGSRFPEFSEDHPRRQSGEALWREIAAQRKILREIGGWEENWGAFREMHFRPIKTKAVRIQFKMTNVGLDEIQIFGPEERNENLAHERHGVKLSGFPEKGLDGRYPISRLNDGEFGTMTWRAKAEKGAEEQPWAQFDFEEATMLDRIRLSSNREFFYDTDYLEKKPFLPRYEFDLQILKPDGTWHGWVGTWFVNKKLSEERPERKKSLGEIQRLIDELAEEGPRPSFVGRFVKPGPTHILHRGSPENPRDEVVPAAPVILEGDFGLTTKAAGSKRRLEFANWISSTENPLTARVMANRIWHHIFGSGIVPTTSDFGTAGAMPTNPDLLDWLAAEFIQPTASESEAWSMKSMIRLLVTSEAFQRSSQPNEASIQTDSGSALLWRFPPRRIEAEVIRDGILRASGKLDPTLGGRSFRIHNEKKTYAQWQVVDNHGPETWRRMLYQERMRRVDDRIFTAFDFPDCGQVRAKRPVSTTPLQALNLMNSDFVIEQSGFLAARALEETDGGDAAIRFAFQQLLTRDPSPDELAACRELDLKIVCRSLINSNEFAFLP
ncbi:MAG: mono/diheme cytochrome c family protein [Verrucomicrobiales bacterium]|jgi:mono/diheme cytochrome c family protein